MSKIKPEYYITFYKCACGKPYTWNVSDYPNFYECSCGLKTAPLKKLNNE
tara:strand:+ start:419 stop:568 length:150 start_codon:yes stop_codon:yes gene_type:complete